MATEFAHEINVERPGDGRVAWLRFTSDHRANVFTLPMLRDLRARLTELRDEDPPRVLVLAGREELFSGGADLTSIQKMDEQTYVDYIETEYEVFRLVETLPFVTVAMIAGACIGNAAELTLACDVRVAADTLKFGLPEMAVGFIGPTQRLARFIGIGKAKDLLFKARLVSATEAEDLGIVNAVVAVGDLHAEVEQLAARYAGIAPIALRLTKAGLESAYGGFSPEHDRVERQGAVETFRSKDFQEGADAVLKRRQPEFTGR